MITTFCLAGFSGKLLDKDHLGGELFTGRFTRRDIKYDNRFFGNANFNDGRTKAKAALLESRGNVVVLGQSMGARVACSLMDDPDVLEACPPSRCVFVLTGNPDRHYGGASNVQYSGITEAYSVTGIPDDVQYRVWDCANQYGIAEDYPADRSVKAAVDNVSSKVHSDYTATFMGDPRNTVWVDPSNPNATYILAPTYPLPTIEAKWYSLQRKADEDAKLRPQVEAAYSRPFPAPVTTINRMWSTNTGYDATLRRFVSMPKPAPWDPFS